MKTEKSSVRNADLNEGNDLILRTLETDGMLFQQSMCLQKKQPDNTLLVK